MPARAAEEPRRGRSQSVRSSASKLKRPQERAKTDRRRVTIAGAKGRRKMDREGTEMSEETLSEVLRRSLNKTKKPLGPDGHGWNTESGLTRC